LSHDSANPIEGTICVPQSDIDITERAVYYISRALKNIALFPP
jgi:hypothetical protein